MPRHSLPLPPCDAELLRHHRDRQGWATGHLKNVMRAAVSFFKWARENRVALRQLRRRGHHAVDLWVTARSRTVGKRTIRSDETIANQFGFDLGRQSHVKRRLARLASQNATKRAAGHQEFSRKKEYPSPHTLLCLCFSRPGDGGLLLEMRAFWYVCIATGNRPKHVYEIISIKVEAEGLYVRWGYRKVCKILREPVFYPYAWTAPPSPFIRSLLTSYDSRYQVSQRPRRKTGWRIHGTQTEWPAQWHTPNDYNAAATVNSWLLRERPAGSQWTSTIGRNVLCSIVVPLVGPANPAVSTWQMFTNVLDHREKTARSNYARVLPSGAPLF